MPELLRNYYCKNILNNVNFFYKLLKITVRNFDKLCVPEVEELAIRDFF